MRAGATDAAELDAGIFRKTPRQRRGEDAAVRAGTIDATKLDAGLLGQTTRQRRIENTVVAIALRTDRRR